MSELRLGENEEIVWTGYKRILRLKNPFTKYTLTNKALYVEKGILTYEFHEIRLFRVVDMAITKTLLEKICKTGSLKVISTDKANPSLRVGSIFDVGELKVLINNYVEKERKRQGVRMGEFIR
jgi:uncharacterized membrane protein YdbT with pleckstrin-like domain